MDPDFKDVSEVLSLSPKDIKYQLFLFKLPRDFNLKQLEDQQIDLKTNKTDVKVGQLSDGTYIYDLYKGKAHLEDTMRPIVKNPVTLGDCSIGPKFSGNISVVRSYCGNNNVETTSYPNVSYSKMTQISDLTVRSLPDGSLTNLKDLRKRLNDRIITKLPSQHDKVIKRKTSENTDTNLSVNHDVIQKKKKDKKNDSLVTSHSQTKKSKKI